jgi:hypothetical protein
MNHLSISEVRADALFVSSLQRSDRPSTGQVRQAVAAAVRQFGGRGCIGLVAQEFGEHPDLAVARMRWALRVAAGAFGERGAAAPAGTPVPAGTACCQPHAA